MANFTIGVDLGGTNLRAAAVDEHGQLLEKITLGTQVSLGRDRVIHDMCDAIQQLAQKHTASSKLLGIGVGVPGIIDMETGMVREAVNLPGWVGFPVHAEIEKRLRAPVVLENDGRAATLGEKWSGAARDVDDMAMLTLGTGVGGGLVLGGKLWYGRNGMAGEFGHCTVEPDGCPCPCGNRGCLEQYASATAIVRMAREAIAAGGTGALEAAAKEGDFSSRTIYDLAMQGNEQAIAVFGKVGRALGIVLASLVNGLNLPMYVIGGGAASAWDAFAPSMFEKLRVRSLVYAANAPVQTEIADAEAIQGRKTIITRALLGSDAGLYGAARLPMMEKSSPPA